MKFGFFLNKKKSLVINIFSDFSGFLDFWHFFMFTGFFVFFNIVNFFVTFLFFLKVFIDVLLIKKKKNIYIFFLGLF